MAEKKKAAKMENHSAEIVTQLLKKGKKNGGTLTYGDLMEALQTQDLSPDEIDDMYEAFSKKGIEIVDDGVHPPVAVAVDHVAGVALAQQVTHSRGN